MAPKPFQQPFWPASRGSVRSQVSEEAVQRHRSLGFGHQFIEVAAQLDLLTPDTCNAARLAKNFRNLIHPGRAARLAQTCDRVTAYSAIGALEHVIRDLTSAANGVA
jgi:hypothetical protein